MSNQNQNALSAVAQTVLPTVIDRELFCVAYYPEWLTDLPTAPLSDETWAERLQGISGDDENRFRSQLSRWDKLRNEANEMPTRTDQTAKSPPPPTLRRELRPGAPYNPAFHIPDLNLERKIYSELVAGDNVSLIGGESQGKTWWAHHILEELPTKRVEIKIVYVDLARTGDYELSTSVYPLLRAELIRQLRLTEPERKRCPESARRFDEVGELVRQYHNRQECAHHRVVLALDGLAELRGSESARIFFSQLRAWWDNAKEYASLLLMLDDELYFLKLPRGSQLHSEKNVVPDCAPAQLQLLAGQYSQELGKKDAHSLWQLLSGQPYLSRMAICHHLQESVSIDSCIEDAACSINGGAVFQEHLFTLRNRLTAEQLDGLRKVYEKKGHGCKDEVLATLRQCNLIILNRRTGTHRLHCRLYLHLLRP